MCIFAEVMKNREDFIEKLSQALESELPGPDSQYKMAPQLRLENNQKFYRNAGVLILLFEASDKWQIVLMKRPEYPGVHSNQVGLPGGIHENSDPDLAATALREAMEELGIDNGRIRLLGKLSKLEIPVSGIEVTPFVDYYPEKPEFIPDPEEVAYLIEVPLANLLNDESVEEEIRTIRCKIVKVPYFQIGEEKVWGATAMILSEFLDVVRNLGGMDLL